MQKAFFKALRFATRRPSAERNLNLGHGYPALSDAAPRETRGGIALTGLFSAVPRVRDWSDPGSDVAPTARVLKHPAVGRLTRTFNYTGGGEPILQPLRTFDRIIKSLLSLHRIVVRCIPVPKWRNWQTRMVQVHVLARVWGFESLLRHQIFSPQ
jgi:hypothetical protein